MADQITYACPVPGCDWRITDTHKETLSGAVLLQLAERQGINTGGVTAGMRQDHDQKLAQTIGQHLRSHPDLRRDPNIPEAAAYLIHRTRQQITDGKGKP